MNERELDIQGRIGMAIFLVGWMMVTLEDCSRIWTPHYLYFAPVLAFGVATILAINFEKACLTKIVISLFIWSASAFTIGNYLFSSYDNIPAFSHLYMRLNLLLMFFTALLLAGLLFHRLIASGELGEIEIDL